MTACPASTSYYIWYRVTDLDAARDDVIALFARLATRTGVHGRLLVRRNEPRTWMEIYADIAAMDVARFEHELDACVTALNVTRWAENGARHAEPFVPPA